MEVLSAAVWRWRKIELRLELLSRPNQGNRSRVARFTADSALPLVTVRFGTTVSAGDIERYAAQLRESRSFRPGFSEIADLRDVEKLDLKAEAFIRLADKVAPSHLNPSARS